jgi:hypothetical protein
MDLKDITKEYNLMMVSFMKSSDSKSRSTFIPYYGTKWKITRHLGNLNAGRNQVEVAGKWRFNVKYVAVLPAPAAAVHLLMRYGLNECWQHLNLLCQVLARLQVCDPDIQRR